LPRKVSFKSGEDLSLFCHKFGKNIDTQIEKKLLALAGMFFQQTPEPVEGVDLVLNNLKNRYTLILATLGDPEYSIKKLCVLV
jgi:hypothetical protein